MVSDNVETRPTLIALGEERAPALALRVFHVCIGADTTGEF